MKWGIKRKKENKLNGKKNSKIETHHCFLFPFFFYGDVLLGQFLMRFRTGVRILKTAWSGAGNNAPIGPVVALTIIARRSVIPASSPAIKPLEIWSMRGCAKINNATDAR